MSETTSKPSAEATRRENNRRTMSIFFTLLLAVMFAMLWGPGAQGCNRTLTQTAIEPVANVNGKDLTSVEFQRRYANALDMYRQQGIPQDMLKQFGVQKQVVEQMVGFEVLTQAAEKRGIVASDEEVRESLWKTEVFQRDNRFDMDTYERYVSGVMQMTPQAYEAKLRKDLSAQKLLQLVDSSVVVSDDEVKARYQKDSNTAKLTYVKFSPSMFAEKVGTPKPAELDAWTKAHDKDIAANYEANKFQYFQPEKVKARQILLRFEKDASPAKKAEVKLKAENLRKEIVDNKKPFADVAIQFSEDLETKEKGGDLGLVERLQLPGAFADTMFALKPGEVSVPVETPIGYHLGTVEEKKAPEQKPLEAVKELIARTMFVKEKAKDLAKADAEKALAEIKKGKTLAELFPASKEEKPAGQFNFAAETKPEAKDTESFASTAESIPTIGQDPALMKAIFDRKEPGMFDEVVSTPDALFLINLAERKVPSDDDFAKQKEKLKEETIKARQYEVREAYIKALKKAATVTQNDAVINRIIEG